MEIRYPKTPGFYWKPIIFELSKEYNNQLVMKYLYSIIREINLSKEFKLNVIERAKLFNTITFLGNKINFYDIVSNNIFTITEDDVKVYLNKKLDLIRETNFDLKSLNNFKNKLENRYVTIIKELNYDK